MIKPNMPEKRTKPIANNGNQGGIRMWPSEDWAAKLYDLANWFLVAALIIGAASTVFVVWMGNVKEEDIGRDLATAQGQAAEAIKKAESERLARIKLEAIIAPRRLSEEQAQRFSTELSPFSGQRIVLSSYAFDTDGIILAGQIGKAVLAAGIVIAADEIGAHIPAHAPIIEGVRVTGTDARLVSALKSALWASDIAVDRKEAPVGAELLEFTTEPKDVVATIYVGAKPIE